jgi:hypothetical protein
MGQLSRPALRADIIDALEKYGPAISGTVADYLHDPGESREVRQSAAAVLARAGNQESADLLLAELRGGDETLETELVDGLDMIRTGHPDVHFSRETIKDTILDKTRDACRQVLESGELGGKPPVPGAPPGQHESRLEPVRPVFQLLGLIYPHEDIARAYQSFRSGTRDSIAYDHGQGPP